MNRFTLPRDLYHGENALEALKTFTGKRAVICVGGGSMKRFGFLDRAIAYLQEAGMEVKVIDGPFNTFNGIIEEIDTEKKKLKITVKIFGRKTPLELGFMQVEKEA